MSKKKSAIIIFGGGLVDPAKVVMLRIANNLAKNQVYEKVYIGRYSFESLFTPEYWLEYNWRLVETVKDKRGTCFGTCRGIYLTRKELFDKAVSCLKARDVCTVIVCGGDGSSRQSAEISEKFLKNGINIIFAIPLTIDGINGGDSVGLKQAVRESVRQIENVASTSLETRNREGYGVVLVEVQGRNRDDIIASVLEYFVSKRSVADCDLQNLLLKVVPANFETIEEVLVDKINKSSKRTLVLISEGANIKVPNLTEEINRKVRTLTIGHASQSNDMTNKEDEHEYGIWCDQITRIIAENKSDSFCVVRNGYKYTKEAIDYYAVRNPRYDQKALLSEELEDLLLQYTVMQ